MTNVRFHFESLLRRRSVEKAFRCPENFDSAMTQVMLGWFSFLTDSSYKDVREEEKISAPAMSPPYSTSSHGRIISGALDPLRLAYRDLALKRYSAAVV